MDLNEIKIIENKIKKVLTELNFKEVIINNDIIYHYKKYYKITYVSGLKAFVIESAINYGDAIKNVYEDSDIYPLSLGSEELIKVFKEDIIKYYIDNSNN